VREQLNFSVVKNVVTKVYFINTKQSTDLYRWSIEKKIKINLNFKQQNLNFVQMLFAVTDTTFL